MGFVRLGVSHVWLYVKILYICLSIDYKIDNIYKLILSNFQRADNQSLKNTFLCDFNSFRGFIKDIAPDILVRNIDDSVEKLFLKRRERHQLLLMK